MEGVQTGKLVEVGDCSDRGRKVLLSFSTDCYEALHAISSLQIKEAVVSLEKLQTRLDPFIKRPIPEVPEMKPDECPERCGPCAVYITVLL